VFWAAAGRVAYSYYLTQRDPALLHQVPASGTTSGWGAAFSGKAKPPADVCALLAPYRRLTVGTDQG
jgi:hypothetical protein